MRIQVINGPNLNLLGQREPEIYGYDTLASIETACRKLTDAAGYGLEFLQSNHEGQIVDWIQAARGQVDVLVINAGAYTHTSVAIHDALRAYEGYVVELHVSNPHARETFRHHSFISAAADAVVVGLGAQGYERVIEMICHGDVTSR
jgi:3-dehydroquinate dehydratase-2